MKKLLFFSLLCTLLFSCQNWKTQQALVGKWVAEEFLVEGKPQNEELIDQISLTFTKEGTYQFKSVMNYREAGTFSIQNRLLLTKDTTGTNPEEKKVVIETLEADTLKLSMRQNEQEVFLTLLRRN